MKKIIRSKSHNSFFTYIPTRPFISSYSNFLAYCAKHCIHTTRGIRKTALFLYFNRI